MYPPPRAVCRDESEKDRHHGDDEQYSLCREESGKDRDHNDDYVEDVPHVKDEAPPQIGPHVPEQFLNIARHRLRRSKTERER